MSRSHICDPLAVVNIKKPDVSLELETKNTTTFAGFKGEIDGVAHTVETKGPRSYYR